MGALDIPTKCIPVCIVKCNLEELILYCGRLFPHHLFAPPQREKSLRNNTLTVWTTKYTGALHGWEASMLLVDFGNFCCRMSSSIIIFISPLESKTHLDSMILHFQSLSPT